MGGWGSQSDTRLDPALVRGLDGPNLESGREGTKPAFRILFWAVVPEIFSLVRTFAPKISGRSPRNPEKALAHAVLTTEGQNPSGKIPADLFQRVRSESFFGQKFLVRNLVRPIFFRLEIFKIQKFSG
jgi:hypothetical protein